jgi:hypothetical protein
MKETYNFDDTSSPQKRHNISNIMKKQSTIYKDDIIIRRDTPTLKKIIKRNRVNKLVRNFCLKMKRNITSTNTQIH